MNKSKLPNDVEWLRGELLYAVERKHYRETELQAHARRIEELKRKVVAKESEIIRLTEELRLTKRRHRNLLRSFSWKITIPLRIIYGWMCLFKKEREFSPYPSVDSSPEIRNISVDSNHSPPGGEIVEADSSKTNDVSILFEPDIYCKSEGKVTEQDAWAHYLKQGWRKGRSPNRWLNGQAYLASNPGIKFGDVSPLEHMANHPPIEITKNEKFVEWVIKQHKGDYPEIFRDRRIVVYSANSNGYDTFYEPPFVGDNIEYIMFTDGNIPTGSAWKKREFEFFSDDPTRTARYAKTHPHFFFEEYDIVIWLDANLELLSDPRSLLHNFTDNTQFSTWLHPLRKSISEEISECLLRKKDEPQVLEDIEKNLSRIGYNEELGLFETSILVSRPKDPVVAEMFSAWWKGIDNGSRRDQLSLPLALTEVPLSFAPIARQGVDMRSDPRLIRHGHI